MEIVKQTIKKAIRRKDIKGCGTCSITHTNNDNRYTNWIRTARRVLAGSNKRLSI